MAIGRWIHLRVTADGRAPAAGRVTAADHPPAGDHTAVCERASRAQRPGYRSGSIGTMPCRSTRNARSGCVSSARTGRTGRTGRRVRVDRRRARPDRTVPGSSSASVRLAGLVGPTRNTSFNLDVIWRRVPPRQGWGISKGAAASAGGSRARRRLISKTWVPRGRKAPLEPHLGDGAPAGHGAGPGWRARRRGGLRRALPCRADQVPAGPGDQERVDPGQVSARMPTASRTHAAISMRPTCFGARSRRGSSTARTANAANSTANGRLSAAATGTAAMW